ncbi:unnamed protein product [Schistocephalus solidus]|uniref:Secreted protein n=1 Tax=Schistocephalus solidus TaxID=70667 RepID=A0A183SD43_SCHSO|nr:unnamed protein product [Schistocephalus solidus]
MPRPLPRKPLARSPICGLIYSVFTLGIAGFFPEATLRVTVTTSGLKLVRVSGAVCAPTPGMPDSRTLSFSPLKKPYVRGDSYDDERLP